MSYYLFRPRGSMNTSNIVDSITEGITHSRETMKMGQGGLLSLKDVN